MSKIEAGTHRAKCTGEADVQFGYTSNDDEQIAVQFELIDGENAGARVTWFGMFTDKSLPITRKALRACGWAGNNITDLAGIDASEVELVIAYEVNPHKPEDGEKMKVKWVNTPGGGKVELKKPMAGDALKAFGAKMRGQFAADAPKPGAPPARGATPTPNGRKLTDQKPPPDLREPGDDSFGL